MYKHLLFLLLGFSYTYAQQSINAASGNSAGSGGSISYTLGLIDYVFASGATGSINQGVQQPFEIFVLGTDEIHEISLELSIHPNPTTDLLFINNENSDLTFHYQLFDTTGKTVASSSKMVQGGQIDMTSLVSGTYLLRIQTNNNLTKSFKIIKK
jgi:hypothetical protein